MTATPRRAGLVGGLAPPSTVDYYQRIIQEWQRVDPSSTPLMIIDSLDPDRALRLVATDRAAFTDYIAGAIDRLSRAGVDFVAIAANTPHIVFDDLVRRTRVPLLSIVETCADEAHRLGLRKLGLLGTRFTMESSFYSDALGRHGIEVFPPHEAERLWVHARYVDEFLKGDFRNEIRERVIAIVAGMRDEHGLDGVILAGTELPLLLRAATVADIPALDTTELHVKAIVDRLRKR